MAGGSSGASGDGAGQTFAEKMMQKMGWAEGKGLGKNESGMKDFIKPKMKFNTKGMGFMGVDNKWVAHQEHFDDLLSSLNKGEKPDQQQEIACLTSESKLRGRTKFYSKMMRGKDLSNRSAKDLSSIIVPLSKKDQLEKPESSKLPSEAEGGPLKSSDVSMNDYFARMMAQRKAKLVGAADSKASSSSNTASLAGSDSSDTESKPAFGGLGSAAAVPRASAADPIEDHADVQPRKKSKKSKTRKEASIDVIDCDDENPAEPAEDPIKDSTERKRKRKKSRTSSEEHERVDEEATIEISEGSESPKPSKKSKRKKHQMEKTGQQVEVVEEAEQQIASPDEEGVACGKEARRKRRKDKEESRKRRKLEDSESDTQGEKLIVIEDDSVDDAPATKKDCTTDGPVKGTKKAERGAGKKVSRFEGEVKPDDTETDGNDKAKKSKKDAKRKQKSAGIGHDNDEKRFDEYSDDATRLNVKLGLLRKIRGPSLKASKAEPVRKLTDEQIQEVYRLWTSGDYGEFMRKIHAGELPRWVGMEKDRVDRMSAGKGKAVDLAELRTILESRFNGSNLDEIWGYTSLPYVAV